MSIQQECLTRVSQCIEQACQASVSSKSVPKECPERVFYKSVEQECPRRVSSKTLLQEWLLMPSSISCSLFFVQYEPFFYVSIYNMHLVCGFYQVLNPWKDMEFTAAHIISGTWVISQISFLTLSIMPAIPGE